MNKQNRKVDVKKGEKRKTNCINNSKRKWSSSKKKTI